MFEPRCKCSHAPGLHDAATGSCFHVVTLKEEPTNMSASYCACRGYVYAADQYHLVLLLEEMARQRAGGAVPEDLHGRELLRATAAKLLLRAEALR